MNGLIGGRTASDLPGLDIAEQKSWQNFLVAALRLYAMLNRRLVEVHDLSLVDVRLLEMLSQSLDGGARMGDLAEALPLLPSRLTRHTRRLEIQALVRRGASPDDRRGVVASITDEGRALAEETSVTYAQSLRKYFFDPLTRSQVCTMTEMCHRITTTLKPADSPV